MPFLANQANAEGKIVPGNCEDREGGCYFRGGGEAKQDTYSVLASFGLRFGGSGSVTGVKARGGIAQYFATGLAAQTLAKQGGVELVVVRLLPSQEAAAVEEMRKKNAALDRVLKYADKEGTVEVKKLKTLLTGTGLQESWAEGFNNKSIDKLQEELEGRNNSIVIKLSENIPAK